MNRKTVALMMIAVISMMLASCQRTVETPKDEIRQYDWESRLDNGNTVSLTFSDSDASFSTLNRDWTLSINGLCSVTDDTLLIFDNDKKITYEFRYDLHGDCIDLSYHGDTVTLEKK